MAYRPRKSTTSLHVLPIFSTLRLPQTIPRSGFGVSMRRTRSSHVSPYLLAKDTRPIYSPSYAHSTHLFSARSIDLCLRPSTTMAGISSPQVMIMLFAWLAIRAPVGSTLLTVFSGRCLIFQPGLLTRTLRPLSLFTILTSLLQKSIVESSTGKSIDNPF